MACSGRVQLACLEGVGLGAVQLDSGTVQLDSGTVQISVIANHAQARNSKYYDVHFSIHSRICGLITDLTDEREMQSASKAVNSSLSISCLHKHLLMSAALFTKNCCIA